MRNVPLVADNTLGRGVHYARLRRIRNEVRVKTARQVLTTKKVAEFLQVSTDTVYRLATSGELQGRKIGRIWRFPKEAIRGYLWERESHEARAEADDAR